jgi:hypothetical protein
VAALAGYFVFSCHLDLVTSSNVLLCSFCGRRLGRGFFRNVVDSFTIALVLSGGGASLSPGLLDVIVGVGLVVSRRVLGLSDLGLS